MAQQPMRMALLHSTITVVARDGLENTTTKAIATNASVNEAYIYRIFESKENLLREVFAYLDSELVARLLVHLPVMYMAGWDYETRCRALFSAVWGFLTSNRDECLCYLRYFYSPYFRKLSSEEHRARYERVIELVEPAFRPRADVWMLLNHMLNIMLDFVVKIFNGELKDSDKTAKHVFTLVFASVKPYLNHMEKTVSEEGEQTL